MNSRPLNASLLLSTLCVASLGVLCSASTTRADNGLEIETRTPPVLRSYRPDAGAPVPGPAVVVEAALGERPTCVNSQLNLIFQSAPSPERQVSDLFFRQAGLISVGIAPGEVGEIVGRSPCLMSGYYNRPDLTARTVRDGWLHSGDAGYLDADGYLFLVATPAT